MTDAAAAELRSAGVADVREHEPLAPLTTLRVGGPARVLAVAENDADLGAIGRVASRHGMRCVVVGRGSNLLVDDDGWAGIAVVLGRGFRGIEVSGARVRVGAAEPMPAVATRVADEGLGGFGWAVAVPGSIGGAVRMNAGAHGDDMAKRLVEADIVRLGDGARATWPVASLGLGYRSSELPGDAVVVQATIELSATDRVQLRREIDEIRAWRREHQPLNEPNCGSVFVNPPGDAAGRLVEASGAKGLEVGGARVSQRHANFIVTRPGATAADVAAVIRRARHQVLDATGVWLRTEVVVLSDDAALLGTAPGDTDDTQTVADR